MHRSFAILALVSSSALLGGLSACSSSSDGGGTTPDASTGSDASADATVSHDDGGAADAGADVTSEGDGSIGAPVVNVLATFDKSKGELPEGLWEISPSATSFHGNGGTPITAFAATAAVVTVGADGGVSTFGALSAAPQSSYSLGVITDAAGNVYFAVAASAAPPNDPAPGIYRFAPGGGMPTAFTLGSAATPPMAFANGLDFIGTDLFVADSEGVIYKVDTAGVAKAWSQDALLAPSTSACGGKVPLPIGANGITHDANAVYVTNTDYGRIVKIPINGDGSAGAASVLKEDCATLVGADGILIDPKDSSFLVALNVLNQVVRVAHDGSTVTVIAKDGPLVNPASPILDTSGGRTRILVTSPAFFAAADGGAPNLSEIVLP